MKQKTVEKKQINLYLKKDNIEMLNLIANGIHGSRSQALDLLILTFIKKLGEKEFTTAVEKGKVEELILDKLKITYMGNANYDYQPLA